MIINSFDLKMVPWRKVADASFQEFRIDFEYSLLGFDLDANRLDMLLRYPENFGHCRRHRHVASTMTLVLEGEQHLVEDVPGGTTKKIYRAAGDYALSKTDAMPHIEHGGLGGGTVLLSMWAPTGILFEYFDLENDLSWTVSVEQYVESWEKGEAYGARPPGIGHQK